MLPKGGCGVWLLTTQKPINSPGWQKGKFALFQMLATASGEGGRNLFKGRHPSLDEQEERLLQADCGGGVLHAVLSNSHLQIGYQWSDQHHLECFRYSSSSAPGSSCSHFFVVNSQNCGSSSLGYSLVIMQLTSPSRVFVSIRQLTGYGSEYYKQPQRKK